MLYVLLLIFPMIVAENDDGILNNPPPKPMKEFLDEQERPPAPKATLTVSTVTVRQNGTVIRLSDGRMFLVHPKYAIIAEGWFLVPEVEVTTSNTSEGYPYKITKKGSTSFVYARKITEETQPNP